MELFKKSPGIRNLINLGGTICCHKAGRAVNVQHFISCLDRIIICRKYVVNSIISSTRNLLFVI